MEMHMARFTYIAFCTANNECWIEGVALALGVEQASAKSLGWYARSISGPHRCKTQFIVYAYSLQAQST